MPPFQIDELYDCIMLLNVLHGSILRTVKTKNILNFWRDVDLIQL